MKADLVKPEEYIGDSIRLLGFDGEAVTVPLWLHIGEYVIKHMVAVCKDPPQQALLGLDIGILDYLMQLEREQREQKEASKLSVNTTTRAQAKAREQQEQKDAELSARDLAQPTPIDSEPEVEAESREVIEDEPEIEPEVEIAELDLEDVEDEEIATESEELAEPIELETVEDSGEVIALPTLNDNQQDKALLREQQQQDESLMSVRGMVRRDMDTRMGCWCMFVKERQVNNLSE